MFPLPWNRAYRKKDGSLSTIDEAIQDGGGQYELPTASSDTKGGVKIGNGLTMTGDVLSADAQLPNYSVSEAGKVLVVNNEGSLDWATVSGNSYGSAYEDISKNIPTVKAEEVVPNVN